MAIEKRSVQRLNRILGATRRLKEGVNGPVGLGDVLDEIVSIVNAIVAQGASGSNAASITAALAADKAVVDKVALMVANGCLSAAGVGIGTADPTKAKVVNAVTYRVNGQIFVKASFEIAPTGAAYGAAAITAAGWLIMADAAGNATVAATPTAVGASQAAATAALAWPAVPANKSVIGAFAVATDGAHAFTPGTTAQNALGMTATYYDGIPSALGAVAPADDGSRITAVTVGAGLSLVDILE